MSFRSSTKMSFRKESSDILDSTTRKENFNRIRNIFEIRRPSKSPNSTLRKCKSSSSINFLNSDEDLEVKSEKSYTRTNSSRLSSTLSRKYKRKSGQITKRKPEKKVDAVRIEADTDSSIDVNRKFHDIHFTPYDETNETTHDTDSKNEENAHDSENNEDFEFVNFERKYIKNSSLSTGSSSLGRRNKITKEITSRRQRKEVRENIKSFIEADSEGETENYRKSLVEEMDLEVAKMKSDGFLDEDDNNIDNEINIYENIDDINMNKQDNSNQFSDDNIHFNDRCTNNYIKYKQLFEGMFNELDRSIQRIQLDCKNEIVTHLNNEGENKDSSEVIDDSKSNEVKVATEDEADPSQNIYDVVCEENDLNKLGATSHVAEVEMYINVETHTEHQSSNSDNTVIESYSVVNNDATTKLSNDSDDNEYDEVYVEYDEPNASNTEDDIFGSLGDDLENGSYFVEAYNIPGKELVIVEISLERRTVNLDKPFSLDSIQQSMDNVDLVFHKKEDKSLNIIEDPKEFIKQNARLLSNGYFNDPESNRSTVYSTTSRDSDVFDTDDEGIGMGNGERKRTSDDNSYNNVRRETFCDDRGIVRIERVGYPETAYFIEEGREPQTPVSRNNSFAQKGKLSYIIDEIKSTEKKYVEDLQKVVKRYIPYIARHTPSNLYGRQQIIFGNIQTLWERQKEFLAALESCGEEVEDIVKTFIDFKALFKLYPKYFNNKPRADVILKEFSSIVRKAQDRFNERLDLSSYLLTPLQRLGKYKLFLENIEKQLRKLDLPTENTITALEIIKTEMSKGNDFVAIASIDNSPILKTDYGSFKMREIFTIVRPRRMESMVFLFENVVVFTTMSNQKNTDIYNYHDSIKMNDLRIATFEDSTMHLTDFTKGKKILRADRFTYVLEAKTEKIKDIWRKAIEDILWQQLYKVKENTLKFYQNNGNKKHRLPKTRTKSTGFSIFYCD